MAKTGSASTVSFLITDGHKVHTSNEVNQFNNSLGIQSVTTAPYSQGGNPAERGIQVIMNGGRASLIHGGGKEWMWVGMGGATFCGQRQSYAPAPPAIRPEGQVKAAHHGSLRHLQQGNAYSLAFPLLVLQN